MSLLAAVPSPCVDVCRMDARTQLCEGCKRTLAEIASWASMSDDEKRAVLRRLDLQRSAFAPGGAAITGVGP